MARHVRGGQLRFNDGAAGRLNNGTEREIRRLSDATAHTLGLFVLHSFLDMQERSNTDTDAVEVRGVRLQEVYKHDQWTIVSVDAERGARQKRHHHKPYEVMLCIQGRCVVTLGKTETYTQVLDPMQHIFIPDSVPHSVEYTTETHALSAYHPPTNIRDHARRLI